MNLNSLKSFFLANARFPSSRICATCCITQKESPLAMADDWRLPWCCEVLWTLPCCWNGQSEIKVLSQWFVSWVPFVMSLGHRHLGLACMHVSLSRSKHGLLGPCSSRSVGLSSILPAGLPDLPYQSLISGGSCAGTEPLKRCLVVCGHFCLFHQ